MKEFHEFYTFANYESNDDSDVFENTFVHEKLYLTQRQAVNAALAFLTVELDFLSNEDNPIENDLSLLDAGKELIKDDWYFYNYGEYERRVGIEIVKLEMSEEKGEA